MESKKQHLLQIFATSRAQTTPLYHVYQNNVVGEIPSAVAAGYGILLMQNFTFCVPTESRTPVDHTFVTPSPLDNL